MLKRRSIMLKEGTWEWAIGMMENGYRITRDEWSERDYYDLMINDDDSVCFATKEDYTDCIPYQCAVSVGTIAEYSGWRDWIIATPLTFNLGDL